MFYVDKMHTIKPLKQHQLHHTALKSQTPIICQSTTDPRHHLTNQTIYKPANQTQPEFLTMSISLTTHAHFHSPFHSHPIRTRSMSISRTLTLTRSRRLFSILSSAVRTDTTTWTPTPISVIEPAAESLFHVTLDISDSPDLVASYTRPGQYLQLKVPSSSKPSFLAIASPPSFATDKGEFQFLVKSVPGSTAELLCQLRKGDVVELTPAAGNGFDIDRVYSPIKFPTLLIFATGSGISPIRSLIESGLSADERSDVRLYYGARNLHRMAYQDRFRDWESSGVKIVPVLSQPDEGWTGEAGYVQAAFCRAKNILSPASTGVVLCGQKQMTEEITSILTEDGVPEDKILKNF